MKTGSKDLGFVHIYLELCGCIEFRLNGVQLHSEMLLVHLDSITTFPLNLLFNENLPGKEGEEKE